MTTRQERALRKRDKTFEAIKVMVKAIDRGGMSAGLKAYHEMVSKTPQESHIFRTAWDRVNEAGNTALKAR